MPPAIRTPRWWMGHLIAAMVVVAFVSLGFWQLRRLADRRVDNVVHQARLDSPPLPVQDLVAGAGDDVASLEYRRTRATGAFDPERQVLVRSQVLDGHAGYHVITPLVFDDGTAVLVNRGWVPLDLAGPPPPPSGSMTVEGWVRLSRPRAPTGPTEPEGTLTVVARVDIERLQQQMPYPLAPIYLVAGDGADGLPVPVAPPDFADEGPHLLYAIQWFAFSLIGVVGYLLLLRRAVQRSRPPDRQTGDHLGPVQGG